MKKLLCALLCLSILSLTTAFAANTLPSPKSTSLQSLDQVVAIANSEPITSTELNAAIQRAKGALMQSNTPVPDAAALRKQVLDQLISEKLQLQIAKQAKINVTNAEVTKAIANIAQHNHMTVTELKGKIVQTGMSYQQYRQEIKVQMTLARVQQAVVGKITISKEDLAKFKQKLQNSNQGNRSYHLADILIAIPDSPTTEQLRNAQSRANAVVTKLKHGADFKHLATLESSGPDALKGGDLGWQTTAELPDIFVKSLTNAKTGEIIGPLQAPNGFHILKVYGVKNVPVKMNQTQLRNALYQQKFQQALQKWLKQLRATAYVKIYNN